MFTSSTPTGIDDYRKWWQNQTQQNEIAQIKQSQAVQRDALEFQKQKFNEVLAMWNDAFGGGQGGQFGGAGASGSWEEPIKQRADLYQPGGQFGAGSKAEIDVATNKGLAAGQIGLAQTGMSSGTNVEGLRAGLTQMAGVQKGLVDERRVAGLDSALTTLGQGRLTEDQIKAQEKIALMNTLSSFSRV